MSKYILDSSALKLTSLVEAKQQLVQTVRRQSEAAPQRTISATTWSPVRRPVSGDCSEGSLIIIIIITDGFPVSRGCKTKEKISVKTRDCENRIEEGTFKRVCYCRRRLCNIGINIIRFNRFYISINTIFQSNHSTLLCYTL